MGNSERVILRSYTTRGSCDSMYDSTSTSSGCWANGLFVHKGSTALGGLSTRKNTVSSVFFTSQPRWSSRGGVDTLHHQWPKGLVCILSYSFDVPNPHQSTERGLISDSYISLLAVKTLAGRDNSTPILGSRAALPYYFPGRSLHQEPAPQGSCLDNRHGTFPLFWMLCWFTTLNH